MRKGAGLLRALCFLTGALACSGWMGAAMAQHAPRPAFAPASAETSKRLTPAQRQERRFLQDAAAQMRFASEASKLVLAQSPAPAVRELAVQIVRQHKTVHIELLRMLQVRGMAPPILSNEHGKVLKHLAKSSGRKQDRLFLEEVGARANGAALRDYERMAQVAEDPVLRHWIALRLPQLREQHALAERALHGGDRQPRPLPVIAPSSR